MIGNDDKPPKPDAADLRWLTVECAAAALAVDGPYEAFLILPEHAGLDGLASSRHPDEAALHDGLAELIAVGDSRHRPANDPGLGLLRTGHEARLDARSALDRRHTSPFRELRRSCDRRNAQRLPAPRTCLATRQRSCSLREPA
jgi:hypothetical protein